MPNYDFKCDECGEVVEERMPFVKAEEGIECECGGHMKRLFSPCTNIQCKWNPPYKPGLDAKKDRKIAFNKQVEKKKLPNNFYDLD